MAPATTDPIGLCFGCFLTEQGLLASVDEAAANSRGTARAAHVPALADEDRDGKGDPDEPHAARQIAQSCEHRHLPQ